MLKKLLGLNLIGMVYCFLPMAVLYAWSDNYTHQALTREAVQLSQIEDYLQNQLGYTDGLGIQLVIEDTVTPLVQCAIQRGMRGELNNRSVSEWLQEGSKLEDAKVWQARSQHHFHDPTRYAGLDNRTDNPDWQGFPTRGSWGKFDLRGESTLDWAIQGTSSTGYPKDNLATWSAARDRFYWSQSYPTAEYRTQFLAETFLAMGHVLHLLQDMGVPAHTRNDFLFAHYRTGIDSNEALEKEVDRMIERGEFPWSGQSPAVFNKLAHYFDTNSRLGEDAENYLGDGVTPPDMWGLAEATNYQFLSLSTIFRPDDGSLYYFPHPAIDKMGQPHEITVEGKTKRYFNGENYGVEYMARESYTYKKLVYNYYNNIPLPPTVIEVIDNTNTTDDNQVIQDYANITIPRTIDYTAGLINYFFRGRLEVETEWSPQGDVLGILIKNVSKNSGIEQELHDGSWELYWDNQYGQRRQISHPYFMMDPMPPSLQYEETLTAELNMSFLQQYSGETVEQYILIFRGGISADPYSPDWDDQDAVAVKMFKVNSPYTICDYQQMANPPDILVRFQGIRGCSQDDTYTSWFNNRGFRLKYFERWNPHWAAGTFSERHNPRIAMSCANLNRYWLRAELNRWPANDYLVFFTMERTPCRALPQTVGNYTWCGEGRLPYPPFSYAGNTKFGSSTVGLWDIDDWESGKQYYEGDQVGGAWAQPLGLISVIDETENPIEEVYTCIAAHTSGQIDDQPGVGSDWPYHWVPGYYLGENMIIVSDCQLTDLSGTCGLGGYHKIEGQFTIEALSDGEPIDFELVSARIIARQSSNDAYDILYDNYVLSFTDANGQAVITTPCIRHVDITQNFELRIEIISVQKSDWLYSPWISNCTSVSLWVEGTPCCYGLIEPDPAEFNADGPEEVSIESEWYHTMTAMKGKVMYNGVEMLACQVEYRFRAYVSAIGGLPIYDSGWRNVNNVNGTYPNGQQQVPQTYWQPVGSPNQIYYWTVQYRISDCPIESDESPRMQVTLLE